MYRTTRRPWIFQGLLQKEPVEPGLALGRRVGDDALGQELHRGRVAVLAPADLNVEPVAHGEVGHRCVAHAPEARVVVDRDLLVAACDAIGRDPATLTLSVQIIIPPDGEPRRTAFAQAVDGPGGLVESLVASALGDRTAPRDDVAVLALKLL